MDSAALTSAAIQQLPAVRSLGRHLVCSYLVKSPPATAGALSGNRLRSGRNERRAVDYLCSRHTCAGSGGDLGRRHLAVSRVNAVAVALDGGCADGDTVDPRRTVASVRVSTRSFNRRCRS